MFGQFLRTPTRRGSRLAEASLRRLLASFEAALRAREIDPADLAISDEPR